MREICPSCGAAITEEKCPYCGIMFYDFSCIDLEKPFIMKVKLGNKVHIFKAKAQDFHIHHYANDTICYADNSPVYSVMTRAPEVTMIFTVLPEKKILGITLDTSVTGEYGEDIISDKYKEEN